MSEEIKEFLKFLKTVRYRKDVNDYIFENNIDIKSLKQELINEIKNLNYDKYKSDKYSTTEQLKVAIWVLESIEEQENNLKI